MNAYDAIVVGTGAAFHLARLGALVLGLDRFPQGLNRFPHGHDRGSPHGQTRLTRTRHPIGFLAPDRFAAASG